MKTYLIGIDYRTRSRWFGDSVFITLSMIALILCMTATPAWANVESLHSGRLSQTDSTFARPNMSTDNYFYHAIEVRVDVDGSFTFRSNSLFDAYGYLYNGSFNPFSPLTNLIKFDDDSGGDRQFRISHQLQSGYIYTLVLTTFNTSVTGSFSITTNGSAPVSMRLFVQKITTFPSILSSSSPTFLRPNGNVGGQYSYQAIRVMVQTVGTYHFTIRSSFDSYGCFYHASFDPLYPSMNLVTTNGHGGVGNAQFQINRSLKPGHTYILVVTTYRPNITGSFTIHANGPAPISMTSITPATVLTTTILSDILSTYTSHLYINDATFTRPYGTAHTYYYYQTIQAKIYASGIYSFSSSSLMDAYGYLYDSSFDPSQPLHNLITFDADSAGDRQFRIDRYLVSGRKYILVVTTRDPGVTGRFSINVVGPALINLVPIKPTTSHSLSTLQIMAITLGCLVLCIAIFGICTKLGMQRTTSNQTAASSRCNQIGELQSSGMDNTYRNITYVPYTIAMPTKPVATPEELPPSYETSVLSVTNREYERTDRF